MNQQERLYLTLLSASLWQQPVDADLFVGIDMEVWQELLKLSDAQRTTAFLTDSILSLPEQLQPPRTLRLKLLLQCEKIEKANRRLNELLAHIEWEYRLLNCPFVLLKGQGVALCYPRPLRRTPGDLDLFLYRRGDYETTRRWIEEKGFPCEQESLKHLGFNIGALHVENHRLMATFDRPKFDCRFREEEQRLVARGEWYSARIGGTVVQLLPPTFNASFLFIHLFHHYIHAGVSTRQLSDWLLLLSKHRNEIDKLEAARMLERLGLSRPASLFASAAVHYLGASPEIFPLSPAPFTSTVEKVMGDILQGAHFGRHHPGKKRPSGVWSGRWHGYQRTLHRTIKLWPVAPAHIVPLPFTKLYRRVRLTLWEDNNGSAHNVV